MRKCIDIICPKCKSHNITIIHCLETQHIGGNKWCLNCYKIFDAKCINEIICDSLEKGNQKSK